MESFFSTVKNELADQVASHGDAKMELFDYIEVFYNQRRRHSTIGRISPAAFERRAQVAQVAQLNRPRDRIKLKWPLTPLCSSRSQQRCAWSRCLTPSQAL